MVDLSLLAISTTNQTELDRNQGQKESRHSALEHLERFCQNVSVGLDSLAFEERQQLLRLVVERAIVKDNSVRVETIIQSDKQNSGLLGTRHPEHMYTIDRFRFVLETKL